MYMHRAYNYRGLSSDTTTLSVADPTFACLAAPSTARASTWTRKRPQATKHNGVSNSCIPPVSRRPIGTSDGTPSCMTWSAGSTAVSAVRTSGWTVTRRARQSAKRSNENAEGLTGQVHDADPEVDKLIGRRVICATCMHDRQSILLARFVVATT
jgi:hypothetical protein